MTMVTELALPKEDVDAIMAERKVTGLHAVCLVIKNFWQNGDILWKLYRASMDDKVRMADIVISRATAWKFAADVLQGSWVREISSLELLKWALIKTMQMNVEKAENKSAVSVQAETAAAGVTTEAKKQVSSEAKLKETSAAHAADTKKETAPAAGIKPKVEGKTIPVPKQVEQTAECAAAAG
jgi:hypothetical protein